MTVLALVTSPQEAAPITRWSARFARARELPLVICLLTEADAVDASVVDLDATAGVAQGMSDAVLAAAAELEPTPRLCVASAGSLEDAALHAIGSLKAQLVVAGKYRTNRKADVPHLGPELLKRSPCDTLLLRAPPGSAIPTARDGDGGAPRLNALVPVAGGPHAGVAIKLLNDVARVEPMGITALYVEPEAGEDAEAVGTTQLTQALRRAGVNPTAEHITLRVEISDDVSSAISGVAAEGYDLLLMGASNQSRVRSWLFGTLPERLIGGPDPTAMGVIRSARPLKTRARETVERWLSHKVPQLERSERVELFDKLQTGSRGGFDFMALTALATGIAALGLIQSAPSVVIGAMLVAPLMTPMLGAGLGLVQGNILLVRSAARSIGNGFLLALSIGFFFGLVVPMPELTHELLSRGAPNLLDLVVALLSGVAAAYAYGRPGLMGALAGVAIAAALVPPIATSGITLARGEAFVAKGAALLFGTNLVAIVLGAATAFWALGVRGNRAHGRKRLWARRATLGLILTVLVLSFPLFSALVAPFTVRRDPLHPMVAERVQQRLPAATVVRIERSEAQGGTALTVRLESPSPAPDGLAKDLALAVRRHTGKPVRLRLVTDIIQDARLAAPPPPPPNRTPTMQQAP